MIHYSKTKLKGTFARQIAQWQPLTIFLPTVFLILGGPFFLSFVPIHLAADEAHYALYGTFPALSYFDHPPLIGWLQFLTLKIIGHEDWMLRLPAALGGLIAYCLLWRAIPGKSARKLAGWLFLSTPIFFLLMTGLVPDSLLLVLVFPIIFSTKKASETGTIRDFIYLGIWIGLACLAKYTGVLLGISAVGYLIYRCSWRILFSLAAWLGACTAFLIFIPVIIWNLQNDFISFAYQLDHGFGRSDFTLINIIVAQISQLIGYGFALYIFSWWGICLCLGELSHKKSTRYENPLLIYFFFALPPLILFFIAPAFGRFLPHWLGFSFFICIVPTSILVSQRRSKKKFVAWSFYSLLVVSLGLTFFIRSMTLGYLPFLVNNHHPLENLYNWRAMSEQLHKRISKHKSNTEQVHGEQIHIFVSNWSYAAQIAWYLRPYPIIVLDQRIDQFDLWFGSPENKQSGYLVIPTLDQKNAKNDALLEQFDLCRLQLKSDYTWQGKKIIGFTIYYCQNYHLR